MTNATLRRITLHTARTKEYPSGSSHHGYAFVAPLTTSGRIDVDAWKANPEACVVQRFWGDEEHKRGRLARWPGGVNGATWGFDYDEATRSDDEAGFRFSDHCFVPGEYVSVRDADGELRTFKVATVEPA